MALPYSNTMSHFSEGVLTHSFEAAFGIIDLLSTKKPHEREEN